VPKAKPFSVGDEEEKTTNDSQWEDEASTTVEQGDVANKVRELVDGAARITITNESDSGEIGESTVDEQRADLGLGITPPPRDELARLIITQGNDLGQEISIQPGKSYSIGRAIDNDFVLTDIAVSRKHFDLRNEDGTWVIVDHGSGNGTVVNGNIEDNPFMLANGDLIEIGNTVFRFEHPNGHSRRQQSLEVDVDEEELSTVAGKPLRHEPDGVGPFEAPVRIEAPRVRPKTLPPPTPLRPHAPSAPPYVPAPMGMNRPPNAPTMLGDSRGLPLPGVMPTTIPGQGPMTPQRPIQYPMATEIPPHSVHAQMLKIAANAGRTDPSTSIVPPTPYGAPMFPPQQLAPQQLSKRSKYLIGAGGLSLLAAILTIAVLKSGGSKAATATPAAATGSATRTKMEEITPAETPPPKPDKVAVTDTPKVAPPPPPPVAPPPPPPPPKIETPKETPKPVETPKETPKQVETPKETPKQVETPRETPKPDKKKPDKSQTKRQAIAVAPPPPPPPKNDTPPPPKNDTPPPAPKKDPDAVIRAADQAYAQRHFNEASNMLMAASKTASDSDAKTLRHRAETIDRFSRFFSGGTAPAASAVDAFEKLRTAQPLDAVLGNAFKSDIDERLKQVASKAALSYMATKPTPHYAEAQTAVTVSESLGVSNNNTKLVRNGIESAARDLYNEASKESDSNPQDAREKLRKLLAFIDQKSPVGDRARKLLKQLDK
jgi:hypothetical protein